MSKARTLDQWLEWQSALNPKEIDLGLQRTADVLNAMSLARPAAKIFTVAGTNGKGSSVAMLVSILLAAGYRVGAYTSPHIRRYNERVALQDEPVSDGQLVQAFQRVDEARAGTPLTFFEFGTIAAIDIFVRNDVDVMVLEVGLGGRLDAVNAVDCDIALISSIGLDHSDWLGTSRDAIGREKAGIFRRDRPAVFAARDMPNSVQDVADQLGAVLYRQGQQFNTCVNEEGLTWQFDEQAPIRLPQPGLAGLHQFDNAGGVLSALHLSNLQVPVEALREGLSGVRLSGRYQRIASEPDVFADVAHNPQAAVALAATLAQPHQYQKTGVVLAMYADKDIEGFLSALSDVVNDWHLAPLATPRGATLDELRRRLGRFENNRAMTFYDDLQQALHGARRCANVQDRIVVTGSFETVAAVLKAGASCSSLVAN